MCGICGIIHFGKSEPVRRNLIEKMNGCLSHRGPDDEGYYFEDGVGLGMRRLSIIDLATGNQPIFNEDGTLCVIFNGAIYNFIALREELQKKGHVFKTRSDTEVIPHLYEEMGVECVQKLRGMFAFALWDKAKKRLLLARDRIGKKPLLYTLQPGWLAFASEIRPLLIPDGISTDVDIRALDLFLSLQYIPDPKTIFKSISKLPPAHRLILEKGRVRVEKYWDLPLSGRSLQGRPEMDFQEAKTALREKLTEAVRLRMVSDVPLGAFLSGGIDSSILVALMSGISEEPVKTFSVGFEESEFSELGYAREVAKRYGTDHTEITVKPEMAEILPKLAWHYGEPYADPSALPSYYVARETRRHVKVALNGDGGDENFAGYVHHWALNVARYWDILPGPLRALIGSGAGFLPGGAAPHGLFWKVKRFLNSVRFPDVAERHLRMMCYFTEEEKNGIYSPWMLRELGAGHNAALHYIQAAFEQCRSEDFISRLLFTDIHTYLPGCLMPKMDIAAMANSLEGRSPFLDHEFVEFAFRLPGRWKIRGVSPKSTKWILKEAMKDLLPPAIYRRGKKGFGIPLGPWLRGELKGYWQEHVLSEKALSRGYFNEGGLRRMFEEHASGKKDHGYKMWALLMLELWHEVKNSGLSRI